MTFKKNFLNIFEVVVLKMSGVYLYLVFVIFKALSMNIPFQITMVMTYGWFQRSFNPEKQYNPTIHACAGAFAGLFKDIFGQILLDMFSFWHSKSKNF